jgi:hypothetical protein
MTIKEKVLNAVTELPQNVDFEEILERLYFLYKVETGLQQVLILQDSSKREAITLVQEGQQKAVLLSLEMFQNLIGISDRREQLSVTGFADTSHQLFTTSGYDSPAKIMQLLHEVKEEIAVERELRLNDRQINA